MQYKFTFELTNPNFGVQAGTGNNHPTRELTGYANTDHVKHTHSNSTGADRAVTYRESMCSMVRTALASIIQGIVPSGFKVRLVGFTASKEDSGKAMQQQFTGNNSNTNNSHPYRIMPETSLGKNTNGLPAILPVTDRLVYDNLCGVRGEAWFDISVLTPVGSWDDCYINKDNPVKVAWEPAFEFRRF